MKSLAQVGSNLLLVGVGLLVGAGVDQAANQPDGAALYKQKCSMCHGADGKGFAALKTPDFTSPKWQASSKDKAMVTIIRLGKKGSTMPAFAHKLKDEEIQAVVARIRTFNSKKK